MTKIEDLNKLLDDLGKTQKRIEKCDLITKIGTINYKTKELKQYAKEKVIPILVNYMRDDAWEISKEAIDSLGRLGKLSLKAIPSLIDVIKWNHYEENKMSAVMALVMINGKKVIERIRKELIPENQSVAFYFANALILLEGQDSQGFSILKDLEEKRVLEKWQIEKFNELCKITLTQKLESNPVVEEYQNDFEEKSDFKTDFLLERQIELLNNLLLSFRQNHSTLQEVKTSIEQLNTNISSLTKDIKLLPSDSYQKMTEETGIEIDLTKARMKMELKLDYDSVMTSFKKRTSIEKQQLGNSVGIFLSRYLNLIDGFDITSSNYKIDQLKIDIHVKNNVDNMFWINLKSPVIFVEIKLKNTITIQDIKQLERYLQSSYLANVGFIFTPAKIKLEVLEYIKSINKIITIIRFDDFQQYFDSTNSELKFLEKFVEKQNKKIIFDLK